MIDSVPCSSFVFSIFVFRRQPGDGGRLFGQSSRPGPKGTGSCDGYQSGESVGTKNITSLNAISEKWKCFVLLSSPLFFLSLDFVGAPRFTAASRKKNPCESIHFPLCTRLVQKAADLLTYYTLCTSPGGRRLPVLSRGKGVYPAAYLAL